MSTALIQTSTEVQNYGQQYVDLDDLALVAMFISGRKPNTQRKYARDLRSLLDWPNMLLNQAFMPY